LIDANSAIVCEGQLDLISLFEAGIKNVVAPQGTAFTETQARTLKRFVDEVVLCFDADVAGQKAAERSLEALLQNDLIVRVAEIPAGEDPDSLVRREGREAFESRIVGAREFFDYWIERSVANLDLSSLAAKMQLARMLAETTSRVHDPLMRGEVVNKVSARLGVSANDFQALLPKQRRQSTAADESRASEIRPAPRHDVAMLCLLALRDEEARNFLQSENWREVLAQVSDAEILVRILESDLRPGDPASLNAFMASLSPLEERLVSAWLLQRMPQNAGPMVKQWWLGIRQGILRRQLEAAESRIRLPRHSVGDVLNLQKQILDLKEQLRELSELSPARVAQS
jgi:DNA primase